MMRVLFVCTYNVFRSMSAQYLLRKYLAERGKDKEIIVASAGTHANSYERPYPYALDRLKDYGCDAGGHKATRVTRDLLASYDLIICMSVRHQEEVRRLGCTNSILFNELAYQKRKDLVDDDEHAEIHGYDLDIKQFCCDVVTYIHDAMPSLYENLVTGS